MGRFSVCCVSDKEGDGSVLDVAHLKIKRYKGNKTDHAQPILSLIMCPISTYSHSFGHHIKIYPFIKFIVMSSDLNIQYLYNVSRNMYIYRFYIILNLILIYIKSKLNLNI